MLGGTVAWLSASAAGLGAIFYAFGYLITLANLYMLGLDLIAFSYDPTFYIRRGANFLLLSAIDVAEFLFALFEGLAPGFLIAFLGILIAFLGSRLLRRRGWKVATKQPFRHFTEHQQVWKVLAYLSLLPPLVYLLLTRVWFPDALTVSGVLYHAGNAGAAGGQIREWIVSGNERELHNQYAHLVQQQVVIGVLLLLAWGSTRAWRWSALLTAPFAVLFAISAACLPLEYGTLALPNRFPPALIRFEHPAEMAGAPPVAMYLLNKTESEFVLWDSYHRKIVWIPSRMLASVEILESQALSQIITNR
jgi:hypothetical protein